MSEDVAQDQNPTFVRVNSMFNVFEVFICIELPSVYRAKRLFQKCIASAF